MIRKAVLNDIFNITQIERDVFNHTLGESFLYGELADNPFSHYFVYEINKEIVGYIGFRIIDDLAEMMNFVIKKDHQKKGYGQELLNHFYNYMRKYNVSKIMLEVRKSNKVARRFYEKNGFVKAYIRKDYYINEDALVYVKEVFE